MSPHWEKGQRDLATPQVHLQGPEVRVRFKGRSSPESPPVKLYVLLQETLFFCCPQSLKQEDIPCLLDFGPQCRVKRQRQERDQNLPHQLTWAC